MQRNKDFSGFLGAPFDLIGQNIQAVLLYVLVVGGLTAVGIVLGLTDVSDTIAGVSMGFVIEDGDSLATAAFEFAAAVIGIIAAYLLMAQFLASEGRLGSTETRIWAYIGMSILSILGYLVGFLLLIIPGLILVVRWSASSGFLIGSRLGIVDSLKASWEATSGYGWPIFFAGLVIALVLGVIGGIIGGLAGMTASPIVIGTVSALAESVGNAVFLALGIGIFCILDDTSEQTAEVFA